MPISADLWKSNVRAEIARIAKYADDLRGAHHSSKRSDLDFCTLEELACALFDDCLFESFIASAEIALTEQQQSAATSFARNFETFFQNYNSNDPYSILDDPNWSIVEIEAKNLLELLFG